MALTSQFGLLSIDFVIHVTRHWHTSPLLHEAGEFGDAETLFIAASVGH
jgi:hypothetical protein